MNNKIITIDMQQSEDNIDYIFRHPIYQECYQAILECEKDREFCHHDMSHFLDVARLAMIFNLQEELNISRRMIYAAAILHDIGRHIQYQDGTPHEIASARIAPIILKDCGYLSEEIEEIVEVIRQHRNKDVEKERSFRSILYRADKMSRSCFACQAEYLCDWKKEKKNLFIKY